MKKVFLDYELFGQPNNSLVVLISGAGAPKDFWPVSFCEELSSNGFYVVRYSHRDTGFSTHFDEPYSIQVLLKDLMHLVNDLNAEKVHLVGHSMGGYISQLAACSFPEKIASLVSVSAGSAMNQESFEKLGMSTVEEKTWSFLMKNLPEGDFEKDLQGWITSWRFLNGNVDFDQELAIQYTKSLYEGDRRNCQVAENHIFAMSTVSDTLIHQIKKIKCPLLVLHGTDDPLVPFDHGEVTAKLTPRSKIIGLKGAGHMFFNRELWEIIADEIIKHISHAPYKKI